jgi:hypothetical protein
VEEKVKCERVIIIAVLAREIPYDHNQPLISSFFNKRKTDFYSYTTTNYAVTRTAKHTKSRLAHGRTVKK